MLCSSLPAITLPDTVTNLGIEIFANCTSAAQVDFGTGLSVIGDSDFYECSGVANISTSGQHHQRRRHCFLRLREPDQFHARSRRDQSRWRQLHLLPEPGRH